MPARSATFTDVAPAPAVCRGSLGGDPGSPGGEELADLAADAVPAAYVFEVTEADCGVGRYCQYPLSAGTPSRHGRVVPWMCRRMTRATPTPHQRGGRASRRRDFPVPKLIVASRSRTSRGPRGTGAGFMLAAAAVMMPSSMALIGQAYPDLVTHHITENNQPRALRRCSATSH